MALSFDEDRDDILYMSRFRATNCVVEAYFHNVYCIVSWKYYNIIAWDRHMDGETDRLVSNT